MIRLNGDAHRLKQTEKKKKAKRKIETLRKREK